MADGDGAKVTYSSGGSGSAMIRKAEVAPNTVILFFPDEAVDSVLDQFRTAGTFTLTSGETSASFPVPGLDSAIAHLKACVEKFPEAEAE